MSRIRRAVGRVLFRPAGRSAIHGPFRKRNVIVAERRPASSACGLFLGALGFEVGRAVVAIEVGLNLALDDVAVELAGVVRGDLVVLALAGDLERNLAVLDLAVGDL